MHIPLLRLQLTIPLKNFSLLIRNYEYTAWSIPCTSNVSIFYCLTGKDNTNLKSYKVVFCVCIRGNKFPKTM